MNGKEKDVFVKLPEDMDLEILSYLEEVDQESFIYTNKFLYDRFYVGKMRELTLQKWKNILHFLVYDDFRSQVLRRAKHPLKQLSLVLPNVYRALIVQGLAEGTKLLHTRNSASFVPPLVFPQSLFSLRSNDLSFPSSLQLKSLSISDGLFYQYFLTAVNRLTSLRLYRDEDQPSFLPRVLSSLQTHSTALGLKELCLSGYRKLKQLPFLAGLKKVTLEFMEEFTSFDEGYFAITNKLALMTVVLNSCKVLQDVSMLGSVPYLMLINCPSIREINGLQKNHSVIVEGCDCVVDYWCSFKEVKELTISGPRNLAFFDRMQYTMITSLTLTDIASRMQYPRVFPSTLKKFVARRVSYFHPRMIESHSLDHVILESCRHCTRNLITISHVKQIEVIDLWISDFSYFSSSNYSITIDHCPVSDYGYFANIENICLRNCKRVDFSRLSGIRNLSIFNCWTLSSTTGGLNYVHSLSFYPAISSVTDKSVYNAVRKVVNLETPFHPLLLKYWSLERFTCEKIIVSKVEEKEWKEILVFWSKEGNRTQKYYMVEYLRRLKKIKFTLKK
eukprot:gene13188-14473_t